MKKILFSLFALLCTMGAWAQIDSENTYSLCSKNGAYMSVGTGATQYNIGRFAFYKVEGEENSYKIFSVDANKWVSYAVAESYGSGANKATLVDDQEAAQKWSVVANASNNGYYNIAPFTSAGAVAGFYWNFHGGAGASNKTYIYDDNKTVGFYDKAGDGGSLWSLEKLTLATQEEIAAAKAFVVAGVGYPKTSTSVYSAVYSVMNALTLGKSTTKHIELVKDYYIACTDIQLPEDGKTYTLSFFDPTGAEHKIASDGTAGAATSGKFYCKVYTNVNEETRYAFIAEDGSFFCSHGVNDNYKTYKFDYNDFTINPMVSVTSNVDQSTKQDRFGYVYLIADHRHNSSGLGSVCLQWSANTYDNSKGAHFENTARKYTTAIKITEVEEYTATNTVLQAASTIPALVTGKRSLGSAIGLYTNWAYDSNSGSDYAGFEAAVNEAAKTKVVNGYTFSGLNLPQSGKFYRIKNSATTPAYLISGTQEKRVDFATDAAEKINSIFCYVDGKLLSYQNGMYLAKRPGENFMGYAQSVGGSTDITFAECGTVGKLNVIFNTNRYLYSNGTGSNAGSSDGDIYYRFTVEEVEWLPIPVNKEVGYATIYSPVELALSSNRFKAYTVSVVSNEFATLEEQTVVPANVGVVLELQQGAEIINDCVYLEIKATETAATSELCGTYADEYIDEDAYVLSAQGEPAVVGFYKATKNQQNGASWLNNGFKAYLPASAVPASARFISFDFGTETAIDELKGENGNVKTVIYDLAGRRVQGAQKGIFIVNGKKVVK